MYVPQDGPYGLVPEEGGAPVEETCYLKSEVDKLIAEKDSKIKKLEKCKQWMKDHFFCEEIASVKERHQKYKRWLKLAEKFKEAKEETKKNRAVRDAGQFLENFNRRKK